MLMSVVFVRNEIAVIERNGRRKAIQKSRIRTRELSYKRCFDVEIQKENDDVKRLTVKGT